jgi:hypothetical protein
VGSADDLYAELTRDTSPPIQVTGYIESTLSRAELAGRPAQIMIVRHI